MELVRNQGWRYDPSGKGHPRLFPPDRSKPMMTVPTTPGNDKARGLKNWLRDIHQRGGIWPVERKR